MLSRYISPKTKLAGGLALALWGVLGSGCSERTLRAVTRGAEVTRAHCVPMPTESVGRAWESAALAVLTSELSPAVMLHSSRPELSLFSGLARWGLGAPTHVALGTAQGVRVLNATADLELPVGSMSEAWLLVWFRGAPGYTWDTPWLVTLQHRLSAARLTAEGLRLSSDTPLGYVAMMPLFGLFKPDTSTWAELPNEVVQKARFWTRALRRYPLAVTDRFRLDAPSSAVVVHHQFELLSTDDDFGTVPLELAPLSPSLGLAYAGGRMPMAVSDPVTDTSVATPHGPYLAVESSTCHEVTFPVLDYVNRTLAAPSSRQTDPRALEQLAALRAAASTAFSREDGFFHQDFGDPQDFTGPPPQARDDPSITDNTCWASIAALFYPRALPYLDATLQGEAKARLHRYVGEWLLQEQRFTPHEDKLLCVGPGVLETGDYGPAAVRANALLSTLWSYAYETQDFALLKERWPLVQRLFSVPRSMSFRSFGRERLLELGDQAAPSLAMARSAHFVGDSDTYAYASYLFARELTHHVVKHTGASYFVAQQPLADGPPLSGVVYPTEQRAGLAGWQLDGPDVPATATQKNFSYRWIRFNDLDVGRFHRENLLDLDRAELHAESTVQTWQWADPGGALLVEPWHDDPHIRPSLKRLRAVVLGESLDELDDIQVPDGRSIFPESASIANALAVLQAGAPPELVPLIEPVSTDYALGLVREGRDSEPLLTVAVAYESAGPPVLYWTGWQPPTTAAGVAAADQWSFGSLTADIPVSISGQQRVSASTVAVTFE